ncbi:glycosyltransferase 87 family protein [Streptacidiphilus sp. P02-A3a]|uniref:glycosyltransferase 87 family protein n=1 Tax=Streptacidiphilus sp. P02-A3a TaxID=2704468 RepID=UPI001CDBAC41|nr:glycosyltransferase 87 family protein [Streptacidiphilus sp. P02-A3a]
MTSLGLDAKDGAAPAAPWSRLPAFLRAPVLALRDAPRRRTLAAFWIGVASLLLYAVVRHLARVSMIDMVVYRAEGGAVAHGHDLYDLRVTRYLLPATYPPFAAMLFTPTAWVPVPLLRILVTGVNLVLLGGFGYLSAVLVGWPKRTMRPALVFLVVGLGVWLEPVFTTLRYGQINLLIGVLVLYDLTRPDSRRSKGAALGLAAAIKITPGLFAVYLLLSGRIRAAVTAGLSCLATILVGLLVLPHASVEFWTGDLYDTSRVGKEYIVDNQSLRGVLDRLLHTTHSGTSTLLLSAAVAVFGLTVSVGLHRAAGSLPRGRAWSVLCCAVTALLISPISWTHHWVWCVPLIVLLAAEAAHERARPAGGALLRGRWRATAVATALGFCSFAMWMVPHKGLSNLRIPYPLQPVAAIYPLLGLAFLLLAGERLRRHRRRRRRRSATAHRPSVPGQEGGQRPVQVEGILLPAGRDQP